MSNDFSALTESLSADLAKHGARVIDGVFVLQGNRAIAWRWPEDTQADHFEVGPAAKAVRTVAELDGALKKIDGDLMASDLAKRQRRDAAIEQAQFDLQIIENGADLDERGIADLERQHMICERPRDPVEQLADQEVRTWFRGLDHKARADALQGASAELLLALVRSPIPMPPGSGEIVAARWRTMRDQAHPERAAAIQGRRARLAVLRQVVAHARAVMPAGTPKPPAMRAVA